MDPRHTKLSLQYNQPNLYSGGRCPSPEVTYPYPLYKDPAMEKLKLAHFKQNQVVDLVIVVKQSNDLRCPLQRSALSSSTG